MNLYSLSEVLALWEKASGFVLPLELEIEPLVKKKYSVVRFILFQGLVNLGSPDLREWWFSTTVNPNSPRKDSFRLPLTAEWCSSSG